MGRARRSGGRQAALPDIVEQDPVPANWSTAYPAACRPHGRHGIHAVRRAAQNPPQARRRCTHGAAPDRSSRPRPCITCAGNACGRTARGHAGAAEQAEERCRSAVRTSRLRRIGGNSGMCIMRTSHSSAGVTARRFPRNRSCRRAGRDVARTAERSRRPGRQTARDPRGRRRSTGRRRSRTAPPRRLIGVPSARSWLPDAVPRDADAGQDGVHRVEQVGRSYTTSPSVTPKATSSRRPTPSTSPRER